MARQERPKEDLIRDATAFVERSEFAPADVELRMAEPLVFVGFRVNGAASFFFGEAPVYQFNAQLEFRRGYDEGYLIKAEERRLVKLRRERSESDHGRVSQLARIELNEDQSREFAIRMKSRLDQLRDSLVCGQFVTTREVPTDANMVDRVLRWLESLPDCPSIASRPNA